MPLLVLRLLLILGSLIFLCWAIWSLAQYRKSGEARYCVQFIGNILIMLFGIGTSLKIPFFTNGQFWQLLWCLGFAESAIMSLAEYHQSGQARHLVIFLLLLAIAAWLLIGTFYRVSTPSHSP